MPKNGQFGEFEKTVACGQTMLPDQSLFDKNWKKVKCDILFWVIFGAKNQIFP